MLRVSRLAGIPSRDGVRGDGASGGRERLPEGIQGLRNDGTVLWAERLEPGGQAPQGGRPRLILDALALRREVQRDIAAIMRGWLAHHETVDHEGFHEARRRGNRQAKVLGNRCKRTGRMTAHIAERAKVCDGQRHVAMGTHESAHLACDERGDLHECRGKRFGVVASGSSICLLHLLHMVTITE